MKKIKRDRKLELNLVVVRILTADELKRARGGAVIVSTGASCVDNGETTAR